MGVPKRKTNIKVYGVNQNVNVIGRRKELLEEIIKSDSSLPDSILHDDLDLGMLEFVINNFKVISEGIQIPIIPKILTTQRWAEYENNWSFSDDDGVIKLPFIAVVRKPEVKFGSNPSIQRTIPDRREFFYNTVPTWDGNQLGADVYKIPQPIAVDVEFTVTMVCTKIRDVNKFNKVILQKFPSRQSYTKVKGHYIPIVLDNIDDSTPMESLDGRRFYVQNYTFTMLGFLIDDEEFEVYPAINRALLMTETSLQSNKLIKKPNLITINKLYERGSVIATYSVVSEFKVDKPLNIKFTDILIKSNGDEIEIPVNIFIEKKNNNGTYNITLEESFYDLSLNSKIKNLSINPLTKSRFNYPYVFNSEYSENNYVIIGYVSEYFE
jgi:hypothetical protein